ncbi:Protein CBG18037 [Caenorhabditis briggsae]|uniref:26S proteasome non-ATPase regulatory subunit 5 n=2 Tax=Caenorhabditis briggsae TaxID=6238 RepID=A8XSW1_CAEBR|nr:Protein CBG18037 [Caenorhabditis briggsae]ULU00722.1 hypothetical protein L3Y34_001269 [Caenorhabditis briggsae]CAP35564.1 Protein CBG18037 [Caenorhabditis briggsae]
MTSAVGYENAIEGWRNDYVSNRNSKKGWEILENLVKMQTEGNQQMETDEMSENCAAFDDFSTNQLIKLIIGDFTVKDLLVDHQVVLLEFIPSAHPNILRHVARIIREKEGALPFLKTESIAVGIAFARRITDSDAGEEIGRLLAHLVDNEKICDELKFILKNNTGRNNAMNRASIFSIATERAGISADASCIRWLYEEILKVVLDKEDMLAQLDAINIFGDIALSGKQNAEKMIEWNIVEKISELMERSRQNPDHGEMHLYGTRFFCYLARSCPQVLKTFPDFVNRLMFEIRIFNDLGITDRLAAFDHFGCLCYSVEAKEMLEDMFKNTNTLDSTLAAAGAAFAMGSIEMKRCTIQAITLIFENATDAMASSWYGLMGDKALTQVALDNVKKPFPELKNCIYDFWQQVFKYPTLVQKFIAFPGFINWSLDEKSENAPEYEMRKRQVIRRVIDLSEKESNILNADAELIGRLKKYLQPSAAPAPRIEEMAL